MYEGSHKPPEKYVAVLPLLNAAGRLGGKKGPKVGRGQQSEGSGLRIYFNI